MNTFKTRFIAPLKNFKPTGIPVKLNDNYNIRLVTEHEKEILRGLRKERFLAPGNNDFVLEALVEQEQEKKYDDIEAQRNNKKGDDAIKSGILVLRLFKNGLIGFDCIIKALADIDMYGYTVFYSHQYITRIIGELIQYEISNNEGVALLIQHWNKYISIVQLDNRPLNWFYKSYHEFYNDDRLLNLVIALESLFLKGDNEKQSLRYKFAIRAAFYLEKEPTKRKDVFEFLSKAYKIRNEITHGEKPNYNPLDVIPRLEEIVRIALTKTLIDSQYYKTLDNNILLNNTGLIDTNLI